jgi:hypothetical protein
MDDNDEFDFPLFSFGVTTEEKAKKESKEEERGRTMEKSTLIKVSLRSPSPQYVRQERPKSYYFAEYTEQEKAQFSQTAVDADDIMQSSQFMVNNPHDKIMDVVKFNVRVERDLHSLKKKSTRPGKKARLARLASKRGIKKRKEFQQRLDQEKHRKLMKKINHKRGGKKHKKKNQKKEGQPAQTEKPKYRTE